MNIKDERVALVSDLHIGKHQNSKRWHNIMINFAKEFRDKLRSDNIKDVIICGDVNDDRNEINVNSLHVLTEIFTLWKEFNIIIIVGNHDCYYKNRSDVNSLSVFSGWSNITIIDEITEYDVFSKKLVFCPWGTETDDIPNCDYIFGHFQINGFNISKVKVCTNGVDSPNLISKADMIFTGHFHIRSDRKYKNGRIIYLGSPYELDWGDCATPDRGFFYLNIPNNEYEFIPSKTPPKHKKIRLSEITSSGTINEDIVEEFKGNFVSLIVDQDIKNPEKLDEFIFSMNKTYGAIYIKPEYLLENRMTMQESNYEFTAVDIKSSIEEFVKMTDYDNKDDILEETYELYEKCNKEINDE
jgi:DNA repair exonuclease SbcCD nuclease subunit